jgi:hypothetical protein
MGKSAAQPTSARVIAYSPMKSAREAESWSCLLNIDLPDAWPNAAPSLPPSPSPSLPLPTSSSGRSRFFDMGFVDFAPELGAAAAAFDTTFDFGVAFTACGDLTFTLSLGVSFTVFFPAVSFFFFDGVVLAGGASTSRSLSFMWHARAFAMELNETVLRFNAVARASSSTYAALPPCVTLGRLCSRMCAQIFDVACGRKVRRVDHGPSSTSMQAQAELKA